MLSGYFPQIGTALVRASVRKTSGGFDPDLIGGEDLDWLMRLSGRQAPGFVKTPSILFSQRKVGDYDDLNRRRIGRSPLDYMRAYSDTLRHFFTYFSQVALIAAKNGDRRRALGAIGTSFRIFPLRTTKYLLTRSRLRSALVLAFFARRA